MNLAVATIISILLYSLSFSTCDALTQSQTERKLFPVSENAKFGFSDSNGNVVIEPQFERVSDFNGGLAMVEVDGKKGYINEKGEIVISPEYEEGEDFSNGRAAVKRDGFWGFIDTKGREIVPTVNVEVRSFSGGLAAVSFQPNGRWGYVNENGDVVIAPKFFKASSFHDGVAAVLDGKFGGDNKRGFIDKNGNYLIKPQYYLSGEYSEGLIPVEIGGRDEKTGERSYTHISGKWGFIDKAGRGVIPAKFDGADEFSEGLANITVGKKYGYIDKTGKIVIEPQFEYSSNSYRCASFVEGRACFERDGKIGFIDTKGDVVVQPQFDYAKSFSHGIGQVGFGAYPDSANERFPVSDNYGLIDRNGRVVYKPKNKRTAPAETPSPVDPKKYEGWQKIDEAWFSFYSPKELKGGKKQGTDTEVYAYESPQLYVSFDIGMMANPAPVSPLATKIVIDGQAATIFDSFDEERTHGRYVSTLYIPLGAGYNKTHFNMYVSSDNPILKGVAEKMFKSLRFKLGKEQK